MSEDSGYKALPTFESVLTKWPIFIFKFRTFLESKDLLYVIDQPNEEDRPSIESPERKSVRLEYARRRTTDDSKVRSLLVNKLADEIIALIEELPTAYAMVKRLQEQFQSTSAASALSRLDKLLDATFTNGEDMARHLGIVNGIINQIKNAGGFDIDKLHIVVLLRSLPKTSDWEGLVNSLKTVEEGDLTKEKVARALTEHAEEMNRVKGIGKQSTKLYGQAFYSDEMQPNYSNERKTAPIKQKEQKPGYCLTCGKPGHWARDCYQNNNRKPINKFERKGFNSRASWAFTSQKGNFNSQDIWIKDSGATRHFTHDRNCLEDYIEEQDYLYVGNGEKLQVIGSGRLRVQTEEGNEVTFEGVQHVPDIKVNLFSTIQSDKKGIKEIVENGSTIFQKNKQRCFSATRSGNQWIMNWKVVRVQNSENKANVVVNQDIWHRRFGHIGNGSLLKVSSMVDGMDLRKNEDLNENLPCSICNEANAKRRHFGNSNSIRASKPLKMIHMDWDIINIVGNEGERYVLTLTDEHSNCRFALTSSNRNGEAVVELFDSWRIWAERTAKDGSKVQCVRTDNAKEFTNGPFRQYLRKYRIDFETSIPYEHQQNGTAEITNRYLMEKARAILLESQLNKKYWPEAVRTAAYVSNRSPHPNGKITCWESFTGIKPKVNHLRIFGSKCWAKIPVEHTTGHNKFQPRAMEGRMIGYAQQGKSYKVLLKNGSIILATSITFDEQPINSIKQQNEISNIPSITFDDDDEEQGSIVEFANEEIATTNMDEIDQTTPMPRRTSRIPVARSEYWKIDTDRSAIHFAFITIKEALNGPDAKEWEFAITKEEKNFEDYKAFGPLIQLPEGKRAIPVRMLLTVKHDGTKKARGVVGGHKMEPGIEVLQSTYSPVPKPQTFRIIITMAVLWKWKLSQADVRAAYLNAELKEEVYVKQFPGREIRKSNKGEPEWVRRMLKSVYGAPQSGANWHEVVAKFLIDNDFKRNKWDPCLFEKGVGDQKLVMLVWVDDTLTLHHPTKTEAYSEFLKVFGKRFNIVDMGESMRYVGIDIIRKWKDNTIQLNQCDALQEAAIYYQLSESRPRSTPMDPKLMLYATSDTDLIVDKPYRGIVGCLMHPMIWSRPDLAFAVSTLGQFLSKPTEEHWEAALNVMKYAKTTRNLGLIYRQSEICEIKGYCDSDWAGDLKTGRSHYGYIFYLGGNVVSWKSKKSHTAATSSTTAELEALYNAVLEGIWISELMHSLEVVKESVFTVYVDNKAVVDVVNSIKVLDRLKHEVVKIEFVREKVKLGICKVILIGTADNPADIFTKSLGKSLFKRHCGKLNLEDMERNNRDLETDKITTKSGGVLE